MVRCKVKCQSKEMKAGTDGGAKLVFQPVSGGSPENESFFRYTPWGRFEFGTVNAAAAAQFEEGKEYYVDFSPVETTAGNSATTPTQPE